MPVCDGTEVYLSEAGEAVLVGQRGNGQTEEQAQGVGAGGHLQNARLASVRLASDFIGPENTKFLSVKYTGAHKHLNTVPTRTAKSVKE